MILYFTFTNKYLYDTEKEICADWNDKVRENNVFSFYAEKDKLKQACFDSECSIHQYKSDK